MTNKDTRREQRKVDITTDDKGLINLLMKDYPNTWEDGENGNYAITESGCYKFKGLSYGDFKSFIATSGYQEPRYIVIIHGTKEILEEVN